MRLTALTALAAAAFLSGCAAPTGPVEVTRFNRTADGVQYGSGSFAIGSIEENGAPAGLSGSAYRAAVEREMQRIGYSDSSAADNSNVIAEIAITVTNLGARPSRSPVSVGVGGSGGGRSSNVGVGVGLDVTNLINPPKARVVTALSIRIINRSSGKAIWEGKAAQQAAAGTPAAQPAIAAAKLAEALFKGFPGVNGETIEVP